MFDKLKKALKGKGEGSQEDYLEIDLEKEEKNNKVLVKLFVLKKYDDVNVILNILREGYTIAIIDIKTLTLFPSTLVNPTTFSLENIPS
ncbi:MAG: hypothetical protein M1416_01455, partial [Candidatus Pacearchaeota archaeon]|nr:hypothetical protein [Candidatus Pacearchaeota archaeon]